MSLLRRCVTAGWVDFVGGDRPMAVLTESGVRVMRGEAPARLLLPSAAAARAISGAGARKGNRAAAADVPLDEAGERLFEALRHHRLEVARDAGVPPYVVASDRTLRDIAALRPRDRDELLLAHGIGPAKVERFGPGLLAVVAEHAGGATA